MAGATSITVHCQFTDNQGKVLLERDINGKVRFFGGNLKATYDFAKKATTVHVKTFPQLKEPRSNRSFKEKKRGGMSEALPEIYIARHGNTAWTLSGQHTGLTDLPLTPNGERNAQRLGERLKGMTFARVFTSPLQRASKTCQLAGFGAIAETDPDLVEWDYGQYEGLTSAQILKQRPDWQLFRDGAPGGESPQQISERAERVVRRVRAVACNVLIFSSGHFIRVLTARWLGIDAGIGGKYFLLSPASLSALSYEHNLSSPVIRLWNDDHHVVPEST